MKNNFKIYVNKSISIGFFIIFIITSILIVYILRSYIFKNTSNLNSTNALTKSLVNVTVIPVVNTSKNTSVEHVPVIYNNQSSSTKQVAIPILMYHHIRNYTNPQDKLGENLSVSPQNFDLQMSNLKTKGYTSISFDQFIQNIKNKIALPNKSVIITFDDGYDNAYINAFPILKKYGLTGSFAIPTGLIGRNGYMTWSQIKKMKAQGQEFVAHTVSHANLTSISDTQLHYELSQSKKDLDQILNQNTQTIVYPYGKYNSKVIDETKKDGYLIGRTTNYGETFSIDNLFEMKIIREFNTPKLYLL